MGKEYGSSEALSVLPSQLLLILPCSVWYLTTTTENYGYYLHSCSSIPKKILCDDHKDRTIRTKHVRGSGCFYIARHGSRKHDRIHATWCYMTLEAIFTFWFSTNISVIIFYAFHQYFNKGSLWLLRSNHFVFNSPIVRTVFWTALVCNWIPTM